MEFEMIAKTFQGLEGVLAEELRNLGANNVEEGRRMVSFTGDKAVLYKANFCCRTALRILKPIYKFLASNADELYEAVKQYDWESVLKVDQTFSIDATVYSEEFRHSRFATYRVKDAIADFFNEKYNRRPSIRINNPDVQFNVHISGKEVTLSLDSSGESLHKRGYRVAQTEAPINEVLAAGILKLAGWDGQCNLIDPMCGSGTFLVEAALMAANINPGVYRNGFAFENWEDFDAELFESIYNDDSNERDFNFKIFGSDISPKAVEIAKRNIKSAGVNKHIEIECKSLQSISEVEAGGGMLVTNPPYGERIAVEDMEGLYHDLGERLKRVFVGYKAWIIGYKNELFDCIGLKPSAKMPMLNGDLECELREYVIFEGKYDDLRRDGGHIKDDDFKKRRGEDKPYKKRKFEETFKDDRKPRRKFGDEKPNKPSFDNKESGKREPRHFRFGENNNDEQRNFGKFERKPRRNFDEKSSRPARFKREEKNEGDEKPERSFVHNEEFSKRVVKFREPQLSKDQEVLSNKLQRRGWRKKNSENNSED